jgi:protein O-GlcNAc transferase
MSGSGDELFREGLQHHRAGRTAEAEAVYRRILEHKPDHFGALQHLGAISAARDAKQEAAALFARAAGLRPADPVIHYQLARILSELERHDEALKICDNALAHSPELAPLHSVRGGILHAMKRYEEALASYDRSLALLPNDPLTKGNRAAALELLGRHEEALSAYDGAIALNSSDTETRIARGLILVKLKRPEQARADFERAVQLSPADARGHLYLGSVLAECGWFVPAVAAYSAALKRDANNAEAYAYRAAALGALHRLDEALSDCAHAIALNPDLGAAYYNRANILYEMGRLEEARADCSKAFALSGSTDAAAMKFLMAARLCDWSERTEAAADLVRRCREGEAVHPFALLCASDDPQVHIGAARRAAGAALGPVPHAVKRDKLRVAYLSPDFRDHPVTHLMAEIVELRDSARFETIGVSLARSGEADIRKRLRDAFDHFVEAGSKSDPELAQLLKDLNIDIVVDLAGYTAGSRTKVLAHRPAPVAVSYLGYPGTTGATYIDYILADETVIPPGEDGFYAEKVVRLPGCFMPRDTKTAAPPPPLRAAAGLPEDAFVFCAFNAAHKIDPAIFDVWMRLLAAVPQAVLWLNARGARERLCAEAEARGIASGRLIFAERLSDRSAYLSYLPLADLFLDTSCYGAHATASDMLWMGVPVLTCRGRSFATRVGASMLKAAGLGDLVADGLGPYERLALDLARAPDRLPKIRERLSSAQSRAGLFDSVRYCRNLEKAYEIMIDCRLAGRAPESFSIVQDAP